VRDDYFANPGDDGDFEDEDVDVDVDDREDFEAYADGEFAGHVSADEIQAGGGKTSKFSLAQVQLASDRLDLAGVIPKFAEWRAEDAKYRGGRKRIIGDRAILIACLLLLMDESPMLITEMANVFRFRLDDDAKRSLGVHEVVNTGVREVDEVRWFNRAWRAFHAVLDTMDPWPAPRRLHNRQERMELLNARDKNEVRRLQERLDWWSGAMLQMTFDIQPREVRRAWGGSLSVDQTAIKAPSQRGRLKLDDNKQEIPKFKADGTEKHVLVLEMEADYYLKKFTKPGGSIATQHNPEYNWSYMVDIVIQTASKPGIKADHPLLALSVGVSKPNEDIGGTTVRAIKSIQDRGHQISRLSADLGYSGGLKAENYNVPLKAMGVPIVTDYKKLQKGVQGEVGGALQVEGGHYCPSTPTGLLNASLDFDDGLIDKITWTKRMADRKAYRVRAKERPDADGHRPMMCPAVGPGATVECVLRDIHNKSSKKAKPFISKAKAPTVPDRICTQSSVDFGPHDGVEHEQLIPYGTEEWQATYKHDRNTVESYNEFLKAGPETLDKPEDRRVRGRAGQQFIVTMLLVSANIRKIARFVGDSLRIKPKIKRKRRRDTLGLSDYVRPDRQPKTVAAKKAAAKRAVLKKAQTPLQT